MDDFVVGDIFLWCLKSSLEILEVFLDFLWEITSLSKLVSLSYISTVSDSKRFVESAEYFEDEAVEVILESDNSDPLLRTLSERFLTALILQSSGFCSNFVDLPFV